MSRVLSIIGASGHGKVVADAASLSNGWNEIVFYDDRYPEVENIGTYKVAGTISDLLNNKNALNVVIAIGNNKTRCELHNELIKKDFTIVTIIHPKSVIAKDVELGMGTVVFAGAIISTGVKIGASCIINSNSVVEHDCIIDDFVHISPGACLAGGVTVGERSWLGISSSIIQLISIGSNVTIGGGSVVISDVAANSTVVGNPAKQK